MLHGCIPCGRNPHLVLNSPSRKRPKCVVTLDDPNISPRICKLRTFATFPSTPTMLPLVQVCQVSPHLIVSLTPLRSANGGRAFGRGAQMGV